MSSEKDRLRILRLTEAVIEGSFESTASAYWAAAALLAGLYATDPDQDWVLNGGFFLAREWLLLLALVLVVAGFFNRYMGPRAAAILTASSAEYVTQFEYKTLEVAERKLRFGVFGAWLATLIANVVTLLAALIAYWLTSSAFPLAVAVVVAVYLAIPTLRWSLRRRRRGQSDG